MNFTFNRFYYAINKEKYLPYLYPLLMPILNFFVAQKPNATFKDMLIYWLSLAIIDVLLILIIQKIIYSTAYKQIIKWLTAFVIGSLVICIYVFLEYRFFHFASSVTRFNSSTFLIRTLLNTPILIAFVESIKLAAERKRINIDNKILENENAKAQFNLLLQQINPHFLFNCFTVLQAMVRTKDERTDSFITKLKEVYQRSLDTEKGTVTLKEELAFFNAFMYLMTLRQENAIFIEIQVSDEALAYQLPAFSLQLLAENCVKHNIASESKPLTIRLHQKDAHSLTLENNYQPRTQRSESFGIGIKNLKKRYSLEGIVQGVQIEKTATVYSTTIKLF
jgi:two-component system, LytTR family, sensor kinase